MTDLGGGCQRLRLAGQPSSSEGAVAARSGRRREPARLITMCWGDTYLRDLTDFTLPALLAPGNLPAFVEDFALELVVVTEARLFEAFARAPVTSHLLRYCHIRLIPIDDLLSPWYGITLTFALLRGFADLGPDMVGAHLLFINTDFVLADDSYRKLAEMIRRGERLVVSPSHCMIAEETVGELRARCDKATGSLSLSHREMAAMILAHRHNSMRSKTVNQQLFHGHFHDQFYWYVDEHTMLARQLPIAVVYMRPERVVTELPTFWDYGMLSEICPTTKPCVLSDSDDFLMAELRPLGTYSSLFRLGWPTVDELAAKLSLYLTKDHHDYGRHTLVLHSRGLPAQLDDEKAQLDTFMAQLYSRLSPPRSYRNHPFWLEGWDRFCVMRAEAQAAMALRERIKTELLSRADYARRAAQLATLSTEIARARRTKRQVGRHREEIAKILAPRLTDLTTRYEEERRRVEQEVEPLQRDYEQKEQTADTMLERLERELAILTRRQTQDIERACEAVKLSTTGGVSPLDEPAEEPSAALHENVPAAHGANDLAESRAAAEEISGQDSPELGGGASRRSARRLARLIAGYRAIFGRLPQTTVWHPYHCSLRYVRAALDAALLAGASDMLFITSRDPLGASLVRELRVNRYTTTPSLAGLGLPVEGDGASRRFDLCFCELEITDLMELRGIIDKIRPALREGAKIIVFHHNRDRQPLHNMAYQFALNTFPLVGKSKISLTGSRASALAMRFFVWTIVHRSASRLSGLLSLAATLAICAPLARLGAWIEEKKNPRTCPKHCTSITIEIEMV